MDIEVLFKLAGTRRWVGTQNIWRVIFNLFVSIYKRESHRRGFFAHAKGIASWNT